MPLDPEVADLLKADLVAAHQSGTQLTGMADRNLTQALGVVQNTVIQSVAATADDAQLFAAMQTSSKVPVQGQT